MQLSDGDKGVVLQRDGRTYAIAPQLSCGLTDPAMLRKLADVAERFGAQLKCTGAQRIAIIGLREEDVDAAWEMLGMPKPAHMTGARVRSVRVCPGTTHCKRARQDSIALGMEIDRRYYGRATPGTTKIGVSGCGNQCSECAIKDIGLIGGARGWHIVVGGQCGTTPRLARDLTDSEVSTDAALATVDRIFAFYDRHGNAGERLSDVILRLGVPALKQAVAV